jgi:hypothetical protein
LISWRWNKPFTWDTRKGRRFFICFWQSRRVRRKMIFCTMEHGMNIGLLKINDLKRCYEKTQTWCASPTRCFLCGTRTTTSKLGCHTLAYYIVMIHLDTYLQIIF